MQRECWMLEIGNFPYNFLLPDGDSIWLLEMISHIYLGLYCCSLYHHVGLTWLLMAACVLDWFNPKTSSFSTRALIWVHFKNVHKFSKLNFSLFSYLNSVLYHLVIGLCSSQKIFRKISLRLFSKVTRSFVTIEPLTFSKIQNSIFIAQEISQYFS